MNVKITPHALSGCIDDVISSKSQAHRALICAALSDAPTHIICNSTSKDVHATARCIEALGARADFSDGAIDVSPITNGEDNAQSLLDCGESGSTLRFMLPLVGAVGANCAFTGQGLLASRPLSPLYEQLVAHGMTISPQGAFPLTCGGKLCAGRYEIAGNISSQFITGLLMALPLLDGDSEIVVTSRLESRPYVDMTLGVLRQFGIIVGSNSSGFSVSGNQHPHSPGNLTIEGDWSNAAFWLTAGALGGEGMECAPLDKASAQGDRAIVDVLSRMGARVSQGTNSVAVAPAKLNGMELDASDIPDLVPIISVAAGAAQGDTRITGVRRLRLKESDRILSVRAMLSALGVESDADDDLLVIHGRGGFTGGTVDSFNDHRIAMAAAVAGSVASGPVMILGAQSSDKSYPGFFKRFAALGGRVEEV